MKGPTTTFRSAAAALLAAALAPAAAPAQRAPAHDYRVLVAAEARDEISRVRFGPGGTTVERTFAIGVNLVEPDGPHGVAVAPDGRHYYVTTGHGTPFGYLWKYDAADDRLVGRVMLGDFPASLQVSPDGAWVYVVNFSLYGEMVPSSVSVVDAAEMVEVARIDTCVMPHGSRFSADGARHYSACMMDDLLVEIDTRTLEVSRHFLLTAGAERGMQGAPGGGHDAHGGHGGHGMEAPAAESTRCSPTWAQPSPDGTRVWVACNATSELVEVDAGRWTVVRRIPAGEGVYNLAVTRDGRRLVATNKRGRSVSVFDTGSGRELARIATTRPVVHGVALSSDDRYAFVSVEGVGSEPGTVEVIDLAALRQVGSADVGQMAGGIDFLAMEPRP
jgi:DNA-binding beta-propeller fold protein YncE